MSANIYVSLKILHYIFLIIANFYANFRIIYIFYIFYVNNINEYITYFFSDINFICVIIKYYKQIKF